jgi:thiamine biosynthesis lipoprotein
MSETLPKHVHVEHVMGTAVTFDVRGEEPPRGVIADAVRWLHQVDAEFSTYKPDSAVCRFDRGELTPGAASDDFRWVLDRCEQLHTQTGGFFDAKASGAYDPSALVKGWSVQRAADFLRAAGVENFCINAGGDVVTRGRPGGGHAWRVGIQHPLDAQAIACVVDADRDLAVATSGLYQRGDHILVPSWRRAPTDVLSTTVVGPDLGEADAYATAAFAMGSGGPAWTLGLAGYESMTILADETVLTTPGFPQVTA